MIYTADKTSLTMVNQFVENSLQLQYKIINGSSLTGILQAWGRLNKKDGLTRYGNSHVKDKTS